jgi:hypothetical protein
VVRQEHGHHQQEPRHFKSGVTEEEVVAAADGAQLRDQIGRVLVVVVEEV